MEWIESALYLLLHSNNFVNRVMRYFSNSNRRLLIRIVLWPFKTPLQFFIKPVQYFLQLSIDTLEFRQNESKNSKVDKDEEDFQLQNKSISSQVGTSQSNHGRCKKIDVDCITKTAETKEQKIQIRIDKAKIKGKEVI